MRQAAFEAVRAAVDDGTYELVDEIFFNAPVVFKDFDEYQRKVIGVTHTRHQLTPTVHAEVRARFMRGMTAEGAAFAMPMRVDLLRKPEVRAV